MTPSICLAYFPSNDLDDMLKKTKPSGVCQLTGRASENDQSSMDQQTFAPKPNSQKFTNEVSDICVPNQCLLSPNKQTLQEETLIMIFLRTQEAQINTRINSVLIKNFLLQLSFYWDHQGSPNFL